MYITTMDHARLTHVKCLEWEKTEIHRMKTVHSHQSSQWESKLITLAHLTSDPIPVPSYTDGCDGEWEVMVKHNYVI